MTEMLFNRTPQELAASAVHRINQGLEVAQKTWPKNIARQDLYVGSYLEEAYWEMAWRTHFMGKIPERWESFVEILLDLEKAKKDKIQLDGILIDACVTHQDKRIVQSTAACQRLTIRQIAMIMVRPDFQGSHNNLTDLNNLFYLQERNILRKKHKFDVGPNAIVQAAELVEREGSNLLGFLQSGNLPAIATSLTTR